MILVHLSALILQTSGRVPDRADVAKTKFRAYPRSIVRAFGARFHEGSHSASLKATTPWLGWFPPAYRSNPRRSRDCSYIAGILRPQMHDRGGEPATCILGTNLGDQRRNSEPMNPAGPDLLIPVFERESGRT